MSAQSGADMRKLGLSLSDLEVVSSMVLAGGYKAWQQHRDSTWVRLDFVSNHGRVPRQSDVTERGRQVLRGRPPPPSGQHVGPRTAGRAHSEAPCAWATAKARVRRGFDAGAPSYR